MTKTLLYTKILYKSKTIILTCENVQCFKKLNNLLVIIYDEVLSQYMISALSVLATIKNY
jgi:hypothetical protein